jgi:Tol biopolymer transport system component
VAFALGQPTDARTWEIVTYDLDTQQLNVVTDNSQRDNWPVYSPDGQWLYWIAGSAAQSVIWRIPADLSAAANRIYSTKDFVTALNISPNGAFLLFNAGAIEEPIGQLFALPTEGGDLETFVVVRAYGADWAQ